MNVNHKLKTQESNKYKFQFIRCDTMKTEKININSIPALMYGEESRKVFIAVHGNTSNKEDEVIKILAR